MTIATFFLLAATTFAESPDLACQITLDRAGLSCNTIDGCWGRKSDRALAAAGEDLNPSTAPLFRFDTVTQADLDALVTIPAEPAAKARLPKMGYETLKEMFAERGHLSQRALERLNPGIDWEHVAVGTKIRIPDFPSMDEELSVWPKDRPGAPIRPEAALVKISLSEFEITVYDKDGRLLALFPCSIAKSKAKLPPAGELKITTAIANPNYTYTPDFTPAGQKVKRYIWPEGPNCPIGVAWLGLNLPGYGIHGTVRPESIGNAESHGCFRLANWNAARLYALCPVGTKVMILP